MAIVNFQRWSATIIRTWSEAGLAPARTIHLADNFGNLGGFSQQHIRAGVGVFELFRRGLERRAVAGNRAVRMPSRRAGTKSKVMRDRRATLRRGRRLFH